MKVTVWRKVIPVLFQSRETLSHCVLPNAEDYIYVQFTASSDDSSEVHEILHWFEEAPMQERVYVLFYQQHKMVIASKCEADVVHMKLRWHNGE